MKKNNGFSKFMILWLGELISSIGSGLTSFGLGVYIFETTGSVTNMALITLLGFLPNLVLSVFAGVLADKYDRRSLIFFFNDTATTEIYTAVIVGSVRCV